MGTIYNLNQDGNSLQVSFLNNLPEGDFEVSKGNNPILIKNITEDILKLQVKLIRNDKYIETSLYPGWNPELIVGIKGVQSNTLQYGY